jgi:hypothetical protein
MIGAALRRAHADALDHVFRDGRIMFVLEELGAASGESFLRKQTRIAGHVLALERVAAGAQSSRRCPAAYAERTTASRRSRRARDRSTRC